MTCLALKLSNKKKKKEKGMGIPPHFIYKMSETVLIRRSFEQDIIQTAHESSCKLPAILITL
jgi:hypothetical protein